MDDMQQQIKKVCGLGKHLRHTSQVTRAQLGGRRARVQALLCGHCCTVRPSLRLSLGLAGIHHRVDLKCRERSPSCPGLAMSHPSIRQDV